MYTNYFKETGINLNPEIQKIDTELSVKKSIELWMLRLDQMHPIISGNKWFKLKFNLKKARELDLKKLVSYGGAYSNHLAALAYAGKINGFKTIGFIRGEMPEKGNETIDFLRNCGMQLIFLSRDEFNNRESVSFKNKFHFYFENAYEIPLGGDNEDGVKGCTEIRNLIPFPLDFIVCACGTATTFEGIVRSLKEGEVGIGFQVMKGDNYLFEKLKQKKCLPSLDNWIINDAYHFGGFAKVKKELIDFMLCFEKRNGIALDQVYNGKMMFGVFDLLKREYFKEGSRIVCVHTGGLQGTQVSR